MRAPECRSPTRPQATTTRSAGGRLLLGKGAVLAHRLAHPLAAESDESMSSGRYADAGHRAAAPSIGRASPPALELTSARDESRGVSVTRAGRPAITRNCREFSRPSPFHPLFADALRHAGKNEIQQLSGFAGYGETRTRTGDTTIFSRYVLAVERREIPGNEQFLRVGLAPLIIAICAGFHAFQGMAGLPSPFGRAVYSGGELRSGPS